MQKRAGSETSALFAGKVAFTMRQPRRLRAWEIMRWLAPESKDVGAQRFPTIRQWMPPVKRQSYCGACQIEMDSLAGGRCAGVRARSARPPPPDSGQGSF